MIAKFFGIALAAALAMASEGSAEYTPVKSVVEITPAQADTEDQGFMMAIRSTNPLLASTIVDYYWATKCRDSENGITEFGQEIINAPQFRYLLELKEAWAKDTRSAGSTYLVMIHANRALNCNDEYALKQFSLDVERLNKSISMGKERTEPTN